MRLIFLFLTLLSLNNQSFSQENKKALGIWQAYLNGKPLKASDIGMTGKAANFLIHYVFTKEACFMTGTINRTSISKNNIATLKKNAMNDKTIMNGFAGEGTYSTFGKIDDMPDELKSKFEDITYSEGMFFIEGNIWNNPSSFYFDPKDSKLKGLNKENILELIKVAPAW